MYKMYGYGKVYFVDDTKIQMVAECLQLIIRLGKPEPHHTMLGDRTAQMWMYLDRVSNSWRRN